ncbi:hypothetical protein CPB83DRAFT_841734 [Crepidotus variabilis]|uniref:Cupin type-2 domain-containing protein n=1 Tax=Crepidotus variabilis TaxID=179855 RepID=A0A9P6EUX5_9AGAR|nr:hypothetical protein CPB83DRAFT_841734 [Crepidotus variabilis]
MSTTPPRMLADIRRIVTTHDASGKSTIQSDTEVATKDTGMLGLRAGRIWVTEDSIPTKDNNKIEDGGERVISERSNFDIVPPHGTNIQTVELAPGGSIPMHRTSSLDYNILVSGKLVLVTEDGQEKHIHTAGDTVIQKGTLHGWKNPSSDQTVRWIVVAMAATPAVVNGVTYVPEFR